MPTLVDTSVWSLVLRRATPNVSQSRDQRAVRLFRDLADGVVLVGAIRQEVLSGIRSPERFRQLRDALRSFPAESGVRSDYERAAEFYNTCRAAGVQGSLADFLLCSVANRLEAEILTLDRDFERFSQLLPIRLVEV